MRSLFCFLLFICLLGFGSADCGSDIQKLIPLVSQVVPEADQANSREICDRPSFSLAVCKSALLDLVAKVGETSQNGKEGLTEAKKEFLVLASQMKVACSNVPEGVQGYSTKCQNALNAVKAPTLKINHFIEEKNDAQVISIVDYNIPKFEAAIDDCKS